MAGASVRHEAAPRVLGMISETTRMRTVITADATPTHTLPKVSAAAAPTPTAPTVWAMVLRLRMAARAWSTLFSR